MVKSTNATNPLTGQVTFFLHDSYPSMLMSVEVENGIAKLPIAAYGAFTVGAVADSGETELELDLKSIQGAPKKFMER